MSRQLDTIKGYIGKPIVLLILDGWGLSPSWGGNAISMTNPMNFNKYWKEYPHAVLQAFRGLADEHGNVGNSEIGHASIGSGRIVYQDITDIDNAIKNEKFYNNTNLISACEHVLKYKAKLHLIGLISDGAVHSHIKHIYALLKLAKKQGMSQVFIHAILDGRDVADQSALRYLDQLEKFIKEIGIGKIVTISGRYYAMEKGGHQDRIETAYLTQTRLQGRRFDKAQHAVGYYYKNGVLDEFIPPCTIAANDEKPIAISDYDSVIFSNFRADRARELVRAYVDKKYFRSLFSRKHKLLKEIFVVTLTNYHLSHELPVHIAFKSSKITNNLASIISNYGIKQLHVAESEKAAHISYFFNGGVDKLYPGENRIIVKSPDVVTYDQAPQMSAEKIANTIIRALKKNNYGFIVANIANADMVGHSGNILAVAKAVEVVDEQIGRIIQANKNGITIITADHGNAEQMVPYKTNSNRETMHTTNPVPFIIIAKSCKQNLMKEAIGSHNFEVHELIEPKYTLADIAPTILDLYQISIPDDMTGRSILKAIGYKK